MATWLISAAFLLWAPEESPLQLAAQYLEAGTPALALPVLQPYLETKNPHAADAFTLMGAALSQMGKRTESDQYLRKALSLKPGLSLAVRLLGVNAFDARDFLSAQSHFEELLKLTPKDEEAHVFLGQIALERREFSRAVREFRASPKLVSSDPHLQILMARALISARQINEGKRILLQANTEDPLLVFEAGRLLLECNENEAAVGNFLRIRGRYPESAALEYNLALAYFRLGKSKIAAPILETLINDRQQDADAFRLLAEIYREQEKTASALDLLQRGVSAAPHNEELVVELLSLCVELFAIDQGLSIAAAGLERHPASFGIYAQRAQLRSLQREQKLAQADYRTAIRLSPRTEWLYLGLSLSLLLDGRLDEARQLLEQRLRVKSGYYVLYLYSEVLIRLSTNRVGPFKAKAREVLERAVLSNPAFAPARLNLARIYAEQGAWEKAVVQYRAAISSEPADTRAYYLLARLLQQNGKPEEAAVLLDQVRRSNREEKELTLEQAAVRRFRALQQSAARDRAREK